MVIQTPLSRIRPRRGGERGAAVFVVLLVILMLTGIGVFATRAASLATLSSGFDRQMTQTHYITEYAIMTTAAELSTNRRDAYYLSMIQSKPADNLLCASIVDTSVTPPAVIPNAHCYRFGYADLEKQMASGGTNVLVMPFVPGNPPAGGGLGFAPIGADFSVEMTDVGPVTPPVAGSDLTSAGGVALKYVTVTLNATGQVMPQTLAQNPLNSAVGQSTSIELSRAHVVVGPVSKN